MSSTREQRICFLVLIGLPGSGKTTFSSFLVQQLEDRSNIGDLSLHCIIHVCYDKILSSFNNVEWNEARRSIARNVDDMIGELSENFNTEILEKYHNMQIFVTKTMLTAQQRRMLIVIDDNMYYRSMRYQYYQIARNHHMSYCQLYLKCNVDKCLHRNFQRSIEEQIPEHTILNMAANLEEPNAYDNTWEVFSTTIISDQPFDLLSFAPLFKTIDEAFAQPVSPIPQNPDREHSQYICSSNLIHQADLILRRIIGNTIKENKLSLPQKQIQHLSKLLNKRKQTLLQQLKLGNLHPPYEIIKGIEEGNTDAMTGLHTLISEWFMKEK